MKIVNKRITILFALLMSIVFASSANADLLYGAMSGGWTTDQVGIIIGNNPPTKSILTNLGGTSGARISAFRTETGGSRVAICQYSNVNNPNGGDDVLIYDPYNTDWKKPLKELPMDKNPVSNVRGMAYAGKYLYACGYDFATVARFDTTNDAYTNDKTFNQLNDGKYHAEAIAAYKGYIYAVITHAANPWEGDGGYSKNKLVKFDADLNIVTSMDLNGKNIDGGTVGAVALKDNKLYIASIGGAQSYSGVPNPGSNIDVVNLDTMEVKELISVKTLKDQYSDDEDMFGEWSKEAYPCDFKGVVVTPAGDVYIIANGWNPNITAVFKTTEADLENAKTNAKTTWKMVKVFYFDAYVFPGAAYDAASGILYVCGAETGEYNGSLYKSADGGASWTRYDSAALGGAFSAVAFDVLLKPTTSVITSQDVTVHSDAGSVTMSGIEVSSDISELSGKDDYSSLVNGVAGTQTIYAGRSIIVNINHSAVPDSAPVTFTIANFSMELHSGGAPKAFIKKHGAGKFDMFNATYDAAAKTLTFTISPIGDYFSEGKIIVGELADKPVDPTSPTSEGASGGGCNGGVAVLALIAAIPLLYRKKMKSRKESIR